VNYIDIEFKVANHSHIKRNFPWLLSPDGIAFIPSIKIFMTFPGGETSY
jgi:hypothetical protein